MNRPHHRVSVHAAECQSGRTATLDLPGSYKPPPVQMAAHKPLQPSWQPPRRLLRRHMPSNPQKEPGRALHGFRHRQHHDRWCCYFGVLTSPVAIGLGIFSVVSDQERFLINMAAREASPA